MLVALMYPDTQGTPDCFAGIASVLLCFALLGFTDGAFFTN